MNTNSYKKLDYLLPITIVIYMILFLRTEHCFDDASFYFKYIDSLKQGYLFKFNVQDPPIWGASSPLWLLIASIPAILFNWSPEASSLHVSLLLSILTILFVVRSFKALDIRASIYVSTLFLLISLRLLLLMTQGLETPLSIFALSLAIWGITSETNVVLIVAIGWLLAVTKIDLIPDAFLFVAAIFLRDKRINVYLLTSLLVLTVLTYYLGYVYFDTVGPNTLLTKWHTSQLSNLPRSWFLTSTLLFGINKYFTCISIFTVYLSLKHKKYLPLVFFLVSVILTNEIAYSLKVPSEPFLWYTMPTIFLNVILSSLGFGIVFHEYQNRFGSALLLATTTAFAIVPFSLYFTSAYGDVQFFRSFINNVEQDRTDIGKWIDANTSVFSTLATGYGSPAYYSHRYTYDWSYLNRRPPDGKYLSSKELVRKYSPDLVVECPYGSGISASDYKSEYPGYSVVKTYSQSQTNKSFDFFCVAMKNDSSEYVLKMKE